MKCKRLFLVCLFAVCCSALVIPQEALTEQYLSIRDKLTDLKKSSELVTEQLKQVSEDLKLSQKEAKAWEETSTKLSENLMNINEQLNECYKTIEEQKAKNKLLTKILVIMIIIFSVLFIIKIVFIILYVRHIPVPRFIDVLV